MKKIWFLLITLVSLSWMFSSCDEDDTYAERRERERAQISSFLKKGCRVMDTEKSVVLLDVPSDIKVISEEDFYANDSTTDVANNEYVLFKGSGVYMQIVRKGTGQKLENGQAATIICRYYEFDIASDTLKSTNRVLAYETTPDIMNCSNSFGVFTASFTSGLMKTLYSTSSVPSGWLIPLSFIRLGRQASPDSEIALVRLILPSTEGQSDALSNVYPCFYEISYQRGR